MAMDQNWKVETITFSVFILTQQFKGMYKGMLGIFYILFSFVPFKFS